MLKLDPRSLPDDPNQPRKTRDHEAFNALVRSIASVGIQQPLLVYTTSLGRVVFSGHQRRDAAIELGLTEVSCVEITPPADAATSKLTQFHVNDHAAKHSVGEKLDVLESYRAAHPEASHAELAKAMGLDPETGQVTRYLAVLDGPAFVREAVERGFALERGYWVTRQPDPVVALAEELAKGKRKPGRRPAAESTERVKRISVQLGGATISVAQKQLDIQALIKSLKGLLKQAKEAESQGVQIGTFAKLLNERNGKQVAS